MAEKRKRLGLHMSSMDIAEIMSEGNPGALRVICELLKEEPAKGLMAILDLDDMNIRGSGIWIAYKDVCGEDVTELMRRVRKRDAVIVSAVPGAVEFGASSE